MLVFQESLPPPTSNWLLQSKWNLKKHQHNITAMQGMARTRLIFHVFVKPSGLFGNFYAFPNELGVIGVVVAWILRFQKEEPTKRRRVDRFLRQDSWSSFYTGRYTSRLLLSLNLLTSVHSCVTDWICIYQWNKTKIKSQIPSSK